MEAQILYTAAFQSKKTVRFAPEILEGARDIVLKFDKEGSLSDIVHVYEIPEDRCKVYNDMADEHLLITYKN